MFVKLRQFATLARLTAVEALRQPIVLLLTTTCVVLTGLVPLLQLHHFGEEGRLERDSGLALHVVFGLLVAVQAAGSALARELRSGTASVVLSKPVGRTVFFLAKFCGVAGVVAAFSACAMLATLLSERIATRFVVSDALVGYVQDTRTGLLLLLAPAAAYAVAAFLNARFRRPFQSSAFWLLLAALLAVAVAGGFYDRTGRWAPYDVRLAWRLLPAGILLTAALVVLGALALALSTRLRPAPTLAICALVFAAGLLADHAFGDAAGPAATVLRAVVPNWQHFWLIDALGDGGTIPAGYVARALAYAAAYTAALLAAGLLAFRRTDVA